MWRTLFFFLKLAIVVAVAVWLARQPGALEFEWLGYRVETSVGVAILAVTLVAVVVALVYRLWRGLRRAPGKLGDSIGGSRRRRGYKALTQGMVAVAAGDAEEARRLARKADKLLNEPPLTMLLSAQAAQLNGDEEAARRYFTAMLEQPETEFLGLRGLITQALRAGDEQQALGYLQRAYQLRPETPWVAETLFKLDLKLGRLEAAERVLRHARDVKAIPSREAKRKRAILLVERARLSLGAGDLDSARREAKEAHDLAPDLVPATALYAQILTTRGQAPRAARLLERSWSRGPHPDLAEAYRHTLKNGDPVFRLRHMEKLVATAADHRESHLALARAAMEAELWGEARRHLKAAEGAQAGEGVCHMMAELEEAEHGDRSKAHDWYQRAALAPADPTWVCDECGATAELWGARCGACGAVDTMQWQAPPHIQPAVLPAALMPEPAKLSQAKPSAARSNGGAEPSPPERPVAPTAPPGEPMPSA